MRANRGKDTGPELLIRRRLHSAGLRYRVHHRMRLAEVIVRPDIVFVRRRVAVFIDGCFWHGCPIHGSWPKANADFWRQKIEANRARDASHDRALREAGWYVVRIWEHEEADEAVARIRKALGARE